MADRRDPIRALSLFLPEAYEIAAAAAPWGRITFGDIGISPGSRNTVPESLCLSIDMRHPDQQTLDRMDAHLRVLLSGIDQAGTRSTLTEIWHSPAVAFDPRCIAAVRQAAANLERPAMDIVSGAGHDSVYVSRVAPTAMIFIPCKNGLSHNEAESVTEVDVAAGGDVLLGAVLALDAEPD